jgi:excinuclease ABC subunit A
VGGTYTDTKPCPACAGARLRPEYLAVTLIGHNRNALSEMPLSELSEVVQDISRRIAESDAGSVPEFVDTSLEKTNKRLHFLERVGLGYLNLNRLTSTLSAGEAQRVKLAGLLGGGLTYLTVLLDEPTRGLHPSEVEALVNALYDLRQAGNTVVVVEHDLTLIRAADQVIDMGPGAGIAGGEIIAQGSPAQVGEQDTATGYWLRGERQLDLFRQRRQPKGWLVIKGARENNLRGETVRLPQGTMVGVCGVSGSGKSTLMIDTIGRALAPKKHTTSVAYEPLEPGEYEEIEGAPKRTVLVDQAKAGVVSPASFLGLDGPLRKLYAASEQAMALGLSIKELSRGCSACNGRGLTKTDMGFLPAVYTPCETCRGSGYRPEAWDIQLNGVNLPALSELTLDQVYELFAEEKSLAGTLNKARKVGLGYLILRQPAYTLSGGEAQRLKIAAELCRKGTADTLYILDEPTVGLHLEDVTRLGQVLDKLVDQGHTVVVVEHHPHLLAACDWLVELGPGGGPDGGRVIAAGTPENLASGDTPTAPYLREVLAVT